MSQRMIRFARERGLFRRRVALFSVIVCASPSRAGIENVHASPDFAFAQASIASDHEPGVRC
jgi:hypothetical protein